MFLPFAASRFINVSGLAIYLLLGVFGLLPLWTVPRFFPVPTEGRTADCVASRSAPLPTPLPQQSAGPAYGRGRPDAGREDV